MKRSAYLLAYSESEPVEYSFMISTYAQIRVYVYSYSTSALDKGADLGS